MRINISTNCKAKLFALSLFFTFTVSSTFAQDYYQGIGAQIDAGLFSLEVDSPTIGTYSETSNPAVPGVFYKATLAFSDVFAVSAYPFVGLFVDTNSRSGGTASVGVSLPVLAELYLGEFDDSAFIVGGGFAFAALGSAGEGGGSIIGPQVSLGGQFPLQGRLIGLRAAYTFGLNNPNSDVADVTKDSANLLSLGFYYVLGQ